MGLIQPLYQEESENKQKFYGEFIAEEEQKGPKYNILGLIASLFTDYISPK